jgi:hypothetical protein
MLQRVTTSQPPFQTLAASAKWNAFLTDRSTQGSVQDDFASGIVAQLEIRPLCVFPMPTASTILFELQDGCLRLVFPD